MTYEKKVYTFGPFRLDVGKRFLSRDGQPVPIGPKVVETLAVLVESKGDLVEKRTLMGRVWPDVSVEESNLTHNIAVLRDALGKTSDGRHYIETIPRRGYRFVAEVGHSGLEPIISPEMQAQNEKTQPTTSIQFQLKAQGLPDVVSTHPALTLFLDFSVAIPLLASCYWCCCCVSANSRCRFSSASKCIAAKGFSCGGSRGLESIWLRPCNPQGG